jgi:hypothetical protein
MVKTTKILTYKVSDEKRTIIEKIAKMIDENIEILNTDVPQDIVALPTFLVFVNLKDELTEEDKNKLLECIDCSRDMVECIVINEKLFSNESALKYIISSNYKKYNETKEIDILEENCCKLKEKIEIYQEEHSLSKDDFLFSECNLVEFFDEDRPKVMKYINDCVKNDILWNTKLLEYIDINHRKISPLTYQTFNKGVFRMFIHPTMFSRDFMQCNENGQNERMLQIHQLEKLCDILAEEIYINKYDKSIESARLERNISKNNIDVTDEHLIAYRLSQKGVFCNIMQYVKEIIKNYLSKTEEYYYENNLFIFKFDDKLWTEIRNFIKNFANLPLWKNKEFSESVFGKLITIEEWKSVFETGTTANGVQVLEKPIDITEMTKSN